jgi:hypothetical protein
MSAWPSFLAMYPTDQTDGDDDGGAVEAFDPIAQQAVALAGCVRVWAFCGSQTPGAILMAGRGPAPKPQRRRRNRPVRGEPHALAAVGWQHGPIPKPPTGLMPSSRTA